ncbi:L-ascorbate oxidase homolog [Neltuma alba]|uniref:L-ascorbate oxidase homolog n=2 Tax=Neltuma alba TaxID=207710 RepID=UPI0010A44849|nr:L-ascorbate oxidase homolog [Prosopis alba]
MAGGTMKIQLVFLLTSLLALSSSVMLVHGEDPYLFFTWKVTYGTASPLGHPQQVILVNGLFPGPVLNSTTNNNIVLNVFNHLDEPLLLTWNGVQERRNSWADGTPGTQCPIPPGTNYTYHFQMKDQIGSYYYYPTLGLQRAAGGFGGITINSRPLIPVPYDRPEEEYTVLIFDWYTQNHKDLQKILDSGKGLDRPNGVLINGKTAKGDGKDKPMFMMKPGKTYKYRICNVGMRETLNFRIQDHRMKLVELEGSHPMQNFYDSLDVHVGQCYAVLVTADNKEHTDYVMLASTRNIHTNPHDKDAAVLTGKAIIRYVGGHGAPSPKLPPAPTDIQWSVDQVRSFRWNLSANAARPNIQGSYKYGQIQIARTIKLVNTVEKVKNKLRYAINGVSHVDPETPLKLAEYFGVANKVFKYNIITDNPPAKIAKIIEAPNVINITYRSFVEIVFENHEDTMQSFNLDGYAFFVVGMEPGVWSPDKRKSYNLVDAVSRHTVPVFPNHWTAILLTFDNVGMWNLRSEMAEHRYLGLQLYISILSDSAQFRDEYSLPEWQLLCGIVKNLPRPKP